jgi:glucokinase
MKKSMDKTLVLAGDVGGTKTNLGLFFKEKDRLVSKVIETFSSPNEPDLEHIIRKFLEIHPVSVTRACFGVAGPVLNGVSKTTNLPWNVSEDRIKKCKCPVNPSMNILLSCLSLRALRDSVVLQDLKL